MPKLIWLGEDNEADEYAGPSYTICYGMKFPKDKPVEVTDEHMLTKARGNRYFKVIEDKPAKEAEPEDEMADVKRVVRKQENPDAQTKAQELTDKAQDLKEKVERKKYNYRKAEKSSGYSPVEKKTKGRKEKSGSDPGIPSSDP